MLHLEADPVARRRKPRFPGLRVKKNKEDKANISLDLSSQNLNWKMKEEKLNRICVTVPELSSAEAASLSPHPFSHSLYLWPVQPIQCICIFGTNHSVL